MNMTYTEYSQCKHKLAQIYLMRCMFESIVGFCPLYTQPACGHPNKWCFHTQHCMTNNNYKSVVRMLK